MNFIINLYYNRILLIFHFIVVFLIFCYAIFVPPILYPDTIGYIKGDIYRSLGYPYFINFFQFLFEKNFLFAIKISQFIIFIVSSNYFLIKIKRILNLKDLFTFTLYLILCIPVFYEQKIINSILTECLSYSLYLLVISNFLNGIIYNKNKSIIYSLLILTVLIQIRSQFLFIIPSYIIILIFLNYKSLSKKNFILFFLAIISIPFISIIVDYSYHSLSHNKNTTTPFTGIQIASLPFFISKKNDYQVFKSKNQQEYFKFIYSKLEKRKLLYSQISDLPFNQTDFYFAKYTEIANKTLSEDGDLYFKDKNFADKIIENDKLSSSMVLPLIIKNLKLYTTIFIKNFLKGIGSSKIFLAYILIFFYGFYNYYKYKTNFSIFIIFSISLVIFNIALVTFAEHVISRYTFYNNWVLLTIILFFTQNNKDLKNE